MGESRGGKVRRWTDVPLQRKPSTTSQAPFGFLSCAVSHLHSGVVSHHVILGPHIFSFLIQLIENFDDKRTVDKEVKFKLDSIKNVYH
jgi:hypothetical protein